MTADEGAGGTGLREAIAATIYETVEWSGCAGSSWRNVGPEYRAKWLQAADALIADGFAAHPATPDTARAWDEGWTEGYTSGGSKRDNPYRVATPDIEPPRTVADLDTGKYERCLVPGCSGDARYPPPGRGHSEVCHFRHRFLFAALKEAEADTEPRAREGR